jgi:Spy/CpxP family protein refolding chaperone
MMSGLGWLTALLLTTAAPAGAQMPGGPPPMMGPPAFLRQLFVPEQIMRYQDELGLSAAQRDAITKEMAEAQKRVVELQWQFESASKKLTDVLSAPRIDEAAAMAQADQVMNLELQIKRTHLALLVRIKNLLTPEQQTKLTELVAKEPPRPGPGPPH